MKLSFIEAEATGAKADLLVLPTFESDITDKKNRPEPLTAADAAVDGLLLSTAQQEGFKGKADQTWTFHTHGKLGATRVMLLGLGTRAKFNPEVLRLACGRAVKTAQRLKLKDLVVALPTTGETERSVRAAAEGLLLGAYRFDRYRTTGKDDKGKTAVASARLALPAGEKKSKGLEEAVRTATVVAEAVNWTRDLVNEPGGVMTPAALADQARSLARYGLKVQVRGRKEIERLKMGMFLGVAQGSQHEPQLIEVSWIPKNPKDAKKAPVALIGKAITFDSGGLSLKTADGMVDMKTDMAGSAAVLGAMRVIADLKPPFPVLAYMGACENMPSGTAYRPGDVLISRRGKTVEITNTDAEGRLVLGDVLTYASEAKPAVMIDLATLTGACIVALGNYIVGAFAEDDEAAFAVLEAAKSAGEEVWRMPMLELQRETLRSEIADMKNSGERWGGAINAAMFLKEFVGDTPWVHLDIAGPSQSPRERGYHGKGATGVGVRTLVEFVRRHGQNASGKSGA